MTTPGHAVEQIENAEGIRLLLSPVFTTLVTRLKTTNFMVDSYGARYTTVQVYSMIIWLTFKEAIADRAASGVKNVTKATACGIRIRNSVNITTSLHRCTHPYRGSICSSLSSLLAISIRVGLTEETNRWWPGGFSLAE